MRDVWTRGIERRLGLAVESPLFLPILRNQELKLLRAELQKEMVTLLHRSFMQSRSRSMSKSSRSSSESSDSSGSTESLLNEVVQRLMEL
jgi:hypothetical protein